MTPADAARWMLAEVSEKGTLEQETAAWYLYSKNSDLTYTNKNGNLSISLSVLDLFKKLDDKRFIVWSRSERLWRKRIDSDTSKERMQH